MSNFENISRETKREAFKGDEDRLQEDTVKSSSIENAMKEKILFAKGDTDELEADVSLEFEDGDVRSLPVRATARFASNTLCPAFFSSLMRDPL